MISHSQNFKNAFTKFGRDIKVKLGYCKGTFNLETQDNKLVLSENNAKLLIDAMSEEPIEYIDENDVISLKKNNLGELYRTYMKSFDLTTTINLDIGDKLTVEIGTTVNNSTEYLNYGTYYIYDKVYDKTNKSYQYTMCDSMLFTMIPFDNSVFYNIPVPHTATFEVIITRILEYCGIPSEKIVLNNLTNADKVISAETFKDLQITFRDVLDQIFQLTGSSLIVTNDGTFTNKEYNGTPIDTIDEDILKDTIIDFEEKFGPLNSLVFTRANGLDSIERKDETSIEENGLYQYVIKDNLIAEQSNRTLIIEDLFDKIKGINYYVCDIETIGLGYIEYMDTFNVEIGEETYNCLCLQNTASLESGMVEQFKGEAPVEQTHDYTNVGMDDKSATITMDKMNGQIVLKTYQDGGKTKISQVRLDSSARDGSLVEISADNIKLEGYTTINGNFKVDLDGDMECNNATIDNAAIDNATITDANIVDGSINITGDINTASIWVNGKDTYSNYYSYMFPDHTDVTDGNNSCVQSPDILQLYATNTNDNFSATKTEISVGDNSTNFVANKNHFSIGTPYGKEIYAWTSTTNPYLTISNGSTETTIGHNSINVDNAVTINANGITKNGTLYFNGCYVENNYFNAPVYQGGALSMGENNINGNGLDIYLNTTSTNNHIYANGTRLDNPSDIKSKQNIKKLTNEYKEKLLQEIRELPTYSYDYKEEYGGDKDYMGIIIQDFEDNEILGKVLHITEYNDIKSYNRNDLSQVNLILIQTLLNKIDKLEKELEEVKNGRD